MRSIEKKKRFNNITISFSGEVKIAMHYEKRKNNANKNTKKIPARYFFCL